ncbi:unnamed protein product [Caretta caretta]
MNKAQKESAECLGWRGFEFSVEGQGQEQPSVPASRHRVSTELTLMGRVRARPRKEPDSHDGGGGKVGDPLVTLLEDEVSLPSSWSRSRAPVIGAWLVGRSGAAGLS